MAFFLRGASSSPCPRSAAKAMTSQPYSSLSQGMMMEVSNPPEYAKTTFFTMSASSSSGLVLLAHEQRHQSLLDVEPVLGLVKDGFLEPVHGFLGDLLPPVGGQAVQHEGVFFGGLHQP